MPDYLDQATLTSPEHKQVTRMRIELHLFLDQQTQTAQALPHVGHAARKPDAHARRRRNHRATSAPTSAVASTGSTPPVMRICGACVKDISIAPGPITAAGDAPTNPTGSGVTVTGANFGGCDISGKPVSARNFLRLANSMLRLMPRSRATAVTVIPGENAAATAARASRGHAESKIPSLSGL